MARARSLGPASHHARVHRVMVVVIAACTFSACGRWGFEPLASRNTEDAATADSTDAAMACQFRDVGVGPSLGCAINAPGELWCWAGAAPQQKTLPGPAATLAIGHNHACTLLDDGRVFCFGSGGSGILGDGLNTSSDTPVEVAGGRRYSAIATSGFATCAIGRTDQRVYCWGLSASGELGLGETPNASIPNDIGITATALSGGIRSFCATHTDGRTLCWGLRSIASVATSVPATVTTPFSSLPKLGTRFGCQRDAATSTLHCAGENSRGQLGLGVVSDQVNTFGQVTGLNDVGDFSVSGRHACAVRSDRSLWCWGNNDSGQLGVGDFVTRTTPTKVPGLAAVDRVAASRTNTCATANGQLTCWGANFAGALGTASSISVVRVPVTTTAAAFVETQVGLTVACARTTTGDVWCWGNNSDGRLGIGSLNTPLLPVKVPLGFAANGIAVGTAHVCAYSSTAIACWGSNSSGQTGQAGPTRVVSPTPVALPSDTTITALRAGPVATCAVTGNALVCWGATFGPPAVVTGLPSVVDVTMEQHQCALTVAGEVWCWGINNSGQLGRGTTTAQIGDPAIPARVGGLLNRFSSVAATIFGTCAVSAGRLYCWGDGIIAPQAFVPTLMPDAPGAPVNVVRVEAKALTSCAVYADNTRYCRGLLYNGIAGDEMAGNAARYITQTDISFSFSSRNGCFVSAAGALTCAGERRRGLLGDGNDLTVSQPRVIPVSCTGN